MQGVAFTIEDRVFFLLENKDDVTRNHIRLLLSFPLKNNPLIMRHPLLDHQFQRFADHHNLAGATVRTLLLHGFAFSSTL